MKERIFRFALLGIQTLGMFSLMFAFTEVNSIYFEAFFIRLRGFQFENCMSIPSTSVEKCVQFCGIHAKSCIGTNVYHSPIVDDNGNASYHYECELCLAQKSKSVTRSNEDYIMFLPYTHSYVIDVTSIVSWVHFPQGLYDGQLIYLRVIPDGDVMSAFFRPGHEWDSAQNYNPDCNLLIQVEFDYGGPRPNKIALDNFRDKFWAGPMRLSSTLEYLAIGRESVWIIFVSEDFYTIYIDGKMMGEAYPRPSSMALKDVVYLRLTDHFREMLWKES